MNQRENESTIVEVDAKSLRLTHLSKVMFPDDGFTKAELLLYYQTRPFSCPTCGGGH